jgi:hypothetical protein
VTRPLYNTIGSGYGAVRQPDPRIAAQIRHAISDAESVVNVGAGSGSYEPIDVPTVAVEPSEVMIAQRPTGSAPVVQARAEHLPFPYAAFDVATAIFTVHHWTDPVLGLRELQRVSGRQVVLTWDSTIFEQAFWFARDYLPRGLQVDEPGTAHFIAEALGPPVREELVAVPADCTDGFYAAYWARPEAFLDPTIRAGISALALEDEKVVAAAVDRLTTDLQIGAWDDKYGHLRETESFDMGYRLIVTE